ncbi:uncharacterized protein LOC125777006 [Bactrocera dorsalis]|uniref:Uncharacterized protein LOC125777006 n=1 Tax=Bactrocera dorsalis TaxID=27457 RepID=A0ABM3JBR7_BACDO|nr:uncharacterized protein LOC125777006 [Bactrocera dorsalis]
MTHAQLLTDARAATMPVSFDQFNDLIVIFDDRPSGSWRIFDHLYTRTKTLKPSLCGGNGNCIGSINCTNFIDGLRCRLTARRHVSSVLDVRALRGPNIDSDHYIVAAKIRTRLCAAKNARQQTQGRFDVEKLQSQQTAERFSTRLALLLSESTRQQFGIRELWDGISNSLRTAATETIGFRKVQKNSWYDEECRVAAERKQATYLATLRSTTTRAGWDRYQELKREARRICRQKKKEAEMREYEQLNKLADRGNARKFYEKMRRLTEGFKTGAYSCRTPKGDLVTDAQSILKLWREHFSSLLNGSESTTPGEGEPDSQIEDDGTFHYPTMKKFE